MANLVNYEGESKIIKRICWILNNRLAKVQDVRRNGASVLNEETGIADVSVPELGSGEDDAFPGNLGQTAYDHSLIAEGNPHHVTARDLGLDTLQDQITALAEAIGTVSYWESHTHDTLTDHDLDPLQFHTTARILEYH